MKNTTIIILAFLLFGLLMFTAFSLDRYDALVAKNKELREALVEARHEREITAAKLDPCADANEWLAEACSDGPKYRALIRVYTHEECKGSRAQEYHECLKNVKNTFETRYHQGMWRD
jgi:DNA-binding SARP family transcriptional activator